MQQRPVCTDPGTGRRDHTPAADVLAQVRRQHRQGERRADLLAGLAVAALVLLVCLWLPAGPVAG